MEDEISKAYPLNVSCSRGFVPWLEEARASLAFTAQKAGKLYFVGLNENRTLAIFERSFAKAKALVGTADTLFLATQYQLWRFDNVLAPEQEAEGYDRLYLPQVAYTTGDLDIQEIAVDPSERPIFVNTLFNCVAVASDRYSFLPLWRPPFVTDLSAGDRCHLTGFALQDGALAYVTSASRSDEPEGWRDDLWDGGCLLDATSGEVAVADLSLPHAPRFYRDRLWLLDSGSGHLGFVDLENGSFEPVALCPGYLRGLAFHGDYAIVGMSQKRDGVPFHGLRLGANLTEREAHPQCAVAIVDIEKGELVHWMRLTGSVTEISGVAVLPDVRRPAAIGLLTDEVCRVISVGPDFAD